MSSEPIVRYKRSAPDAPVTSNDEGNQSEARKLRQRAQSLIRLRGRGTKS